MRIQLDMPVGINHLYKSSRHGWYKDSKAVVWQNTAIVLIKNQMRQEKRKTITKACSVALEWHRKDKRRADIDSGLKLTLDTLVKAGVMTDDSLIDDLHAIKVYNPKILNNYCVVEVV